MRSNNLQPKKAFTLIELLIVIVIIGILASLATVALGGIRMKGRDAKRISDIKQMQSALELYFSHANAYPVTWVPGQPLILPNSNTTVMNKMPSAPAPITEGACASATDYSYTYTTSSNTYSVSYCLAGNTSNITAGSYTAMPGNISVPAVAITVPSEPFISSAVRPSECASPFPVTVTWQAPLNDGGSAITGYKVYVGSSSNNETLTASVGSDVFSRIIMLREASTFFKISAVNAIGESAMSAEVNVAACY